jgi:hypothetical protein
MATDRPDVARDDSRRTIIIVVAVVAAAAIGILFYFLMRASGTGTPVQATLPNAIRPGSAEWNEYAPKLVRDEPEAFESKRALGDTVMTLRTVVRNFTGRTVDGLEVKGSVVDHQGKPVKEKTVVVIPTRQPELGPNKTIQAEVTMDGFKDTDDRANIQMEITGFRLKP